jgi:putative holliday junction resolvase
MILGIDYGLSKIGLALSEGRLASPHCVLRIKDLDQAIEEIRAICLKEKIEKIVLGIPLNEKDSSGVERVKLFGERLQLELSLAVFYQDETMSTKEARAKMLQAGKGQKARRLDDAAAAAVILQEFLDRQNSQ